jgi:restriction system protein
VARKWFSKFLRLIAKVVRSVTEIDFYSIREDLDWLRGEDGVVPETQAIAVLSRILNPLMSVEGFAVLEERGPQESGVDLVAKAKLTEASIGIEYKHHGKGKPIELVAVEQLLRSTKLRKFDRLMLIGRFGFTTEAREAAERNDPIRVELLDLSSIRTWIDRVEAGQSNPAAQVQLLIRTISHEFAKLVSEKPETLDHLEWRDLERMMERVMAGLGFSVTLTQPSKDGGKDLILTCRVKQGEESFVVELKHWRSGKKVGRQEVSDFLQVMIAEDRAGGLFLSTSGYADDAFQQLTEFTRQRLRIGDRTKIVLLAQTYVKAFSGLWSPPDELPQVLFEATL